MNLEEVIDFIIKDWAKAGTEITREEAKQILMMNYAVALEKLIAKKEALRNLYATSAIVIIGLAGFTLYKKLESKKTK